MISRRKILITSGAAAVMSPQILRARSDPLVLVQRMVNAPPRCQLMEDGTWVGFEVDLSSQLCERAGVRLAFPSENYVWSRALKLMETGALDLLTAVSWRKDRTTYLDYIGPYDTEEIIVVVRKDNADVTFETLDDFMIEDRIFERVESAVFHPDFDKRVKNDPQFASHFIGTVSSATGQSTLQSSLAARVALGRVFGALTDSYTFAAIQKLDPSTLSYDPSDLTYVRATVFGAPTTYLTATRTLSQQLRDDLRKAYQTLRENGDFEELWTKWYGTRLPPPVT